MISTLCDQFLSTARERANATFATGKSSKVAGMMQHDKTNRVMLVLVARNQAHINDEIMLKKAPDL